MVRLGRAFPVDPHTASTPVSRVALPFHYYFTTFPATENPISQGGVWSHGGADGGFWSNIRTTTNKAFGTQDGNQGAGVYNDSLAVLKGIFGADQRARGKVFNTHASGLYYLEVELLLRFAISFDRARGYEILFSTNSSAQGQGSYCEIVKWLGPHGGDGVQFTSLTGQQPLSGGAANNDDVSATIVGNTITAYRNNIQVAQVTDSSSPWTDGNPGMGHWLRNNGATGDPTLYGYTEFLAQTLDIRAFRQVFPREAVRRAVLI